MADEPKVPAAPASTVPMVDRKGNVVDVPAEQATQAYNSGQYGFKGNTVHTVDDAGKVGQRSIGDLDAALDAGEQLATGAQVHEAHLDAKYGGLGGSLAAAGEGAARGLTLGLSDPLAVGAARLFGGSEAAEQVRTHLAEDKEAHGILSTGAEVLGAGIPMALSGGASIPEEAASLGARAVGAAGEAGVFGRIAEGAGTLGRTLGALPRGVGMAGDAAEHAVSSLLGEGAESVLGRAGQAAAKTAARAVTEAGLFGGGEAISDSTLQNTPLTAEKLFSAVGHSALMGGLVGGALGGGGSLVSSAAASALEHAGPKLEDLAGYQAWKWLGPRNTEAKLATRAGGPSQVGRTWYDLVMRPAVDEEGMSSVAAWSHEEKLAATQKALDGVGKKLGYIAEGSGAEVQMKDFLQPIEKRIEEHSGELLGGDKIAVLQKLKDDVVRVLGGADFEEKELGNIARKAASDAGYEAGSTASQQFEIRYIERLRSGGAYDLGEAKIPIADALRQRRALQKIAFTESKAFDPKMRVQILRDIAGDWNDLEAKTLNEASAKEGGIAGDQFRAFNKQFQQLKIAESTIQSTTDRYAANNSLSLSDNLYGAMHFGGMLAAGHPLGALGAVATAYGHKAIRMRGNAYAAVMLDRLSTWGGVARATADADRAVDKLVAKAVTPSTRTGARVPRAFAVDDHSEESYEHERERIASIAAMAPGLVMGHLQEKTQSLQTHAPQLAMAMQQQAQVANKFLASKLPPLPPLDPLQGKRPKGSGTSPAQRNQFLRYVRAVDGGPERALERLSRGRFTSEDAEVLHKVYPATMPELQNKVRQQAGQTRTHIPYQRRVQLSLFLGAPTDTTMASGVGNELQMLAPAEAHEQPSDTSNRGPAKLALQDSINTPTQRAAAG